MWTDVSLGGKNLTNVTMELLDEGVAINVGNVLIALDVITSMVYVNLDVPLDSLA